MYIMERVRLPNRRVLIFRIWFMLENAPKRNKIDSQKTKVGLMNLMSRYDMTNPQ